MLRFEARNMKLRSFNQNSNQRIQKLVKIYQRFFSILSLNFEDPKAIGKREVDVLASKKYPFISFLVFVFMTSVLVISQQLLFKTSSLIQLDVAFCSMVSCLFLTITFPMVQSIFHYREIHIVWCKVDETACLALKELQFEICFNYCFWKRFLIDCATSLTVFGINVAVGFAFMSTRVGVQSQVGMMILQAVVLYMRLHALFIVNLYNFLFHLLIEFVDSDYRNRTTNLVFDPVERSLCCQLKSYKHFHYKLWEIAAAINKFSGDTLLAICYYTLAETAYSSYYIFYHVAIKEKTVVLIRNM